MSNNQTLQSSSKDEPSDQGGWQLVTARNKHNVNQRAYKTRQSSRKTRQTTPTPIADVSDDIQAPNAPATSMPTKSDVSKELKLPAFPRPHRRDHIFSATRAQLIDYNRQSLAHFTDPLRVEATTSIATSYSHGQSNEATLALRCRKAVEYVQLKLVRGERARARIGSLMYLAGEVWKPFAAYLDGLETPEGQTLGGEYGIEQQLAWWSKNGKAFRFLDLPAELRDAVYEYIVPQDLYPTTWVNGIVSFRHGSERHLSPLQQYRKYDSTYKVVPQPDFALRDTCCQLSVDIKKFIEIHSTKCFRYPQDLSDFTKKLGQPDKSINFGHIELDFSHEDYFHFFGVNVEPFARFDKKLWQIDTPDLAATLRSLPHVKSITLRFTSPFDSMRFDPWGYTGAYRDDLEWYHDWRGFEDQDGFTTSCQKTIVDWILTYAKEYVQHIKEVRLAGAIKTSTKLKWDFIFNEEKNGVHHDMTEEKELISATEGPPACFCTNNCIHDEYLPIAHFEACPNRDCGCHRGNVIAKQRYWVGDLKKYEFDFGD